MKGAVQDVFADTAFWIGLVVKQDQFHEQAQRWSLRVRGRITTTAAVLLETETRSLGRLGGPMGLPSSSISNGARM